MTSVRHIGSEYERLRFLAEVGRKVHRTHDYPTAIADLASACVPELCDWCVVDLFACGPPRRVGIAHVDPDKAMRLRTLGDTYLMHWLARGGAWHVLRSGLATLDAEVSDTRLAEEAFDTEHFELMRDMGTRSVLVIPLVARQRTFGTLTLVQGVSGRRFAEADKAFGLELAGLAAAAIDGALLKEEVNQAREELESARRLADQAAKRAGFLAAASKTLTTSLDKRFILDSLCRLVVPRIVACATAEVFDSVGTLTQVCGCSQSQAMQKTLGKLNFESVPCGVGTAYHKPIAESGGRKQLESDQALAQSQPADRSQAACKSREAVLRRLHLQPVGVIPLIARERLLGTVTLWSNASGPPSQCDIALAEELAHRGALALDNARLYEDAQRAIAIRDEFLSIASHELRTPLTALELNLGNLARLVANPEQTELRERIAMKLGRASRQTDRLAKLVDDLLDVSRNSAAGLQLERHPMNLSQLVQAIAERWSGDANRAGCALRCRADTAVYGCWDAERLEHAIANLLANAIKYGEQKPIEIELSYGANQAILTVRDQGMGIPPEAQDRIFGRFERAVSSRAFGGLGLGLYLVRQIVESHGGAVTLESTHKHGSCFTIRLPDATLDIHNLSGSLTPFDDEEAACASATEPVSKKDEENHAFL